MSVLETEEMKSRVPVATAGIIIGSLFIGGLVGYFISASIAEASAQDRIQRIETEYMNKAQALEAMYMNKIQDMQHQFALDEVGGVRSDMDKEDRRLLGEINELKRKVEDLQK